MVISACMIVKDSGKFLRQCLDSIRGHVDQIVVVDTGSKDGSVEIARNFGAEVYSFVWCDDFSAARNESIKYARGDWILQVDSDHVLEVSEGFDLRDFLRSTGYLGFFIKEISILGGGKKQFLDRMLLFKKVPGVRYRGVLHEHPVESLMVYAKKKGLKAPFSPLGSVRVLHYGYFDIEEKLKRNIRILEKGIAQEPYNWHYRYKLLLSYRSAGKKEKFEELLWETYSLMGSGVGDRITLAMVGIAGVVGKWMVEAGYSDDEAVSFLERYYKLTQGKDLRIVLPLAEIWYKRGDYRKAFEVLKEVLKGECGPGFIPVTEGDKNRAIELFLRVSEALFDRDEAERMLADTLGGKF